MERTRKTDQQPLTEKEEKREEKKAVRPTRQHPSMLSRLLGCFWPTRPRRAAAAVELELAESDGVETARGGGNQTGDRGKSSTKQAANEQTRAPSAATVAAGQLGGLALSGAKKANRLPAASAPTAKVDRLRERVLVGTRNVSPRPATPAPEERPETPCSSLHPGSQTKRRVDNQPILPAIEPRPKTPFKQSRRNTPSPITLSSDEEIVHPAPIAKKATAEKTTAKTTAKATVSRSCSQASTKSSISTAVGEADKTTGKRKTNTYCERKECYVGEKMPSHYHCDGPGCDYQSIRPADVNAHIKRRHPDAGLTSRKCTDKKCPSPPKHLHCHYHAEGCRDVFVEPTSRDNHSADRCPHGGNGVGKAVLDWCERKECYVGIPMNSHHHCDVSGCDHRAPRLRDVNRHIGSDHPGAELEPRQCTDADCPNPPKHLHCLHRADGCRDVFTEKTQRDNHSADGCKFGGNKKAAVDAKKAEQLGIALAAMEARIRDAQPRQHVLPRVAPISSSFDDAVWVVSLQEGYVFLQRAVAFEAHQLHAEESAESARIMKQYLPAMSLLYFSCSEPSLELSARCGRKAEHTRCGHRDLTLHVSDMQQAAKERGEETSCSTTKYNLSIRVDFDLEPFRNKGFVVAPCCYTLFHKKDPILESHYPKCKVDAKGRITDEIAAFLEDLYSNGIPEYDAGPRSECKHCKAMGRTVTVSDAGMNLHFNTFHRPPKVASCSVCPIPVFRTSTEWREHCGRHEKWLLERKCSDEPVLTPKDNPTHVPPPSDDVVRARCCWAWFSTEKEAVDHESQCTSPWKSEERIVSHVALDVLADCEVLPSAPYTAAERLSTEITSLFIDPSKKKELQSRFASGIMAEQPDCARKGKEWYVYALVRIPKTLKALTSKDDVLRYVIYIGMADDPIRRVGGHLSGAAAAIAKAGGVSEQELIDAGSDQPRLRAGLAQLWKKNEEDVMMLPVEVPNKEMAEHIEHVTVEKLLPCGILNSLSSTFKATTWSDGLRNEAVAMFISELEERFICLLDHRQEWMSDGGLRLVRNDPYAGIGNRQHSRPGIACVEKIKDQFDDRSHFLVKINLAVKSRPHQLAQGVAALLTDPTKKEELARHFALGIMAEQPDCARKGKGWFVYALVRIPKTLKALTSKDDVLPYVIYIGMAVDPADRAGGHLSGAASSIAKAKGVSEQDLIDAGSGQPRLHAGLAQLWKKNEEDVMMLPVEVPNKEMAEHIEHVTVEKLLPCGILNSLSSTFKPTSWSDNLRNEAVAMFISEVEKRFVALLSHRREWMPDGGLRPIKEGKPTDQGNRKYERLGVECVKKIVKHFADKSQFTSL